MLFVSDNVMEFHEAYKIFSNNKKSLHQLVVSLDKNNWYEAISCVDNTHKMQEIVRSKNK